MVARARFKSLYAVYEIQPDDRNHLIIYPSRLYIRLGGKEFTRIIRGDTGFLEEGVWSNEVKKIAMEIADLFKNNMVEYIEVKDYVGLGAKFKYVVKPPFDSNIIFEQKGLMLRRYTLTLEDKIAVIELSLFDNRINVYEKPLKRRIDDPIAEIRNALAHISENIFQLTVYLSKTKSYEKRYKPLIDSIWENIKIIKDATSALETTRKTNTEVIHETDKSAISINEHMIREAYIKYLKKE